MKIHNIFEPFPHMLIDDFLDEYSYKQVFDEILNISPNFAGPEQTRASQNKETQEYVKKGSGVFVESLYSDRNMSSILKCFEKMFTPVVLEASANNGWFFKYYYKATNNDWTLVQSYGQGDFYKKHQDQCLFTAITLIVKEPRQYEGGELFFEEHNYFVDLKTNQTIIFPSLIPHEVLPITRSSNNIEGNRFTVTKFIHIKNQ